MFFEFFDLAIIHLTFGISDFAIAYDLKIFPFSFNGFTIGEFKCPFSWKFVSKTVTNILKPAFELEMTFNFDAVLV